MFTTLLRASFLLTIIVGIWLQPAAAQVDVSLPTTSGTLSETQFIPVTVGSLTGENITSYQFTVTYDPTIIEITSADVSGTLSEGISPTVNTATTGQVSIAWAAASPLADAGTLINLSAELVGEGTTALAFSDFVFNEGAPSATLSAGEITVTDGTTPTVNVNVPATTNTSTDASSVLIPVDVSDITDLGVSSYTFVMTYDPAIMTITGVDAAGTLSSSGTPIPNTGTEGQIIVSWATAVPPSGAGTLINLVASPVAEGTSALAFTSFQFNDGVPASVTTNGTVVVSAGTTADTTAISIGANLTGNAGEAVTLPVTVDDVTGKDITSYSFTLAFDPALMDVTGASSAGTLSATGTLSTSFPEAGKVTVSWSNATALSGAGALVNILADLKAGGTSSLSFESASFNSGSPVAEINNGAITITGAEGPVTVTLPTPTGSLGEALMIPVDVSDYTAENITSFTFTITYDAAIIDVTEVLQEGTLTEAVAAELDGSTSGQATVTWASPAGLSGTGPLIQLKAVLLAEGESALTFSNMQFNAGNPESITQNGSVTVTKEDAPPVIGVSISKASTGSAGESLVVPVQVGSVSDQGITSFAFQLTYDPSVITITGAETDGTLSAGAAAVIDASEPGQVNVSWERASALVGSGTLINLSISLDNEGTSALTFGSFQFNDGIPPASTDHGSISVSNSENTIVGISLPNGITGAVGDEIGIPLTVGMLDGKNVTGYSFVLAYEQTDLVISGASTAGTLSSAGSVSVDTSVEGQVTVTFTSSTALVGSGTLLLLDASLVGPGTSALTFLSFTMNGGDQPAAAVGGSITVQGVATFLQFIHNSPDAPIVDVYINDELVINSLSYANATEFVEINTPVVKIDLVHDLATTNNSPITTTNLTLVNDVEYVGVINGLYTVTGSKQLALIVDETGRETEAAEEVELQVFQGSPDAPQMSVNVLDSSGAHRLVASLSSELNFGASSETISLPPDVYHLQLVDPSGGEIGVFRADLSRTAGSSLLFIIQGFVAPSLGEPALTVTGYAPDGRGLFLPSSVAAEDEAGLPEGFILEGNYPNPFNPSTTIRFALPEAAEVKIDVYDMLGRHVMSLPAQRYLGGENLIAQLDASELASGTYMYRLLASGATQQYASSATMTLLR